MKETPELPEIRVLSMSKKQREPEVMGGEVNWPGLARLAVVPYRYILNLRFGNARNIIYFFEKLFPPPPVWGGGRKLLTVRFGVINFVE
ncbi:MAG: hypothetical protein ACM3N7_06160 [Planctomycetaceae bacterium]